jgi:hypothetical protein
MSALYLDGSVFFFIGGMVPSCREDIDGSFLLGLAAGEVLFAEVLVTPTGVSKGCGFVLHSPPIITLLT